MLSLPLQSTPTLAAPRAGLACGPPAVLDWADALYADPAPDLARRMGRMLLAVGAAGTLASTATGMTPIAIGCALLLLGALLARAPVWRLGAALWPWAGLLLWQILSVGLAWASDNPKGLPEADWQWRWLLLPLALIGFRHAGARRIGLILFAVLAIAALATSFGQLSIGRGRDGPKPWRIDPAGPTWDQASGFMGLALTYGAVMASAVPAAWWASRRAGLPAWLAWPLRVALPAAVLLCSKRSPILALLSGITAALLAGSRRQRLAAALVVALMLPLAFVSYRALFPHRATLQLIKQDARWPMWSASLLVIRDQPLVGAGDEPHLKSSYEAAYDRLEPPGPRGTRSAAHLHSSLLQLTASHGVPAGLLWLAGMLGLVVVVWQHDRGRPPVSRQVVAGVVAAQLAMGLFENTAGDSESQVALFLWTGLAMSMLPTGSEQDHHLPEPASPSPDPQAA